MKPLLISLFDYSGHWSKPYQNTWDIIQVDIKLGIDIFTWTPIKCDAILAAPPCDHFTLSGARWWKEKDKDGRTQQGIDLFNRTLEIIERCEPSWYAIENPPGRLQKLINIGSPKFKFHPYEYAGWANQLGGDNQQESYTKKTYLWGNFNNNLIKNSIGPLNKNYIHYLSGKNRKEIRSITPLGFSWAFWSANQLP